MRPQGVIDSEICQCRLLAGKRQIASTIHNCGSGGEELTRSGRLKSQGHVNLLVTSPKV